MRSSWRFLRCLCCLLGRVALFPVQIPLFLVAKVGHLLTSPRRQKSYDSEIHSPNEMVVDTQDDYVVQSAENEKDQLAIINPDNLENDAEQVENVPLATDCTCRGRNNYRSYLRWSMSCADLNMQSRP